MRRPLHDRRTVSERLLKYNAIASEALYNPPKLAGRLHGGPYGDYVLTVTRLEHVKRVDLAIDAFEKTAASVRLADRRRRLHPPASCANTSSAAGCAIASRCLAAWTTTG